MSTDGRKKVTSDDIHFAVKGRKYDTGDRPAITGIGDTLVEVHNGGGNNNLYYDLFKVTDDGEFHKIVIGKKYDTGDSPTIAALPESDTIIEIHNGGGNNNLYYSVGHLDGSTINWNTKGVKYGRGDHPAVAVTKSNVVVEVHNDGGNNLYYRVGRLNMATEKIQWKDSDAHQYDTGDRPSLWITDENRVIEIHSDGGNNLYYNLGMLDPDNLTLIWQSIRNKYDTGDNVAVVVDSTGLVMEVHNGGGNNNLYYRMGSLGENYIAWHGSGGTKYDEGNRPSLACVPGAHDIIVECHNGGGNNNLYQTSINSPLTITTSPSCTN